MRRCRKMISLIMLMVMLVSLLPSGAMAAEAPTGATNEIAAVEEPNDAGGETTAPETGEETVSDEDAVIETSGTGTDDAVVTDEIPGEASDSDGTEEAGVENTAEVAAMGETSAEIAPEVEPAEKTEEAPAAGDTSVEIAPVVEPVEKEAKSAGTPINLAENNRIKNVKMQRKGLKDSDFSDITDANPIQNGDQVYVDIDYGIEEKTLSKDNRVAIYDLPKGIVIDDPIQGDLIRKGGGTVGRVKFELQSDDHIRATLTFDEKFADGTAMLGDFYFQGKLRYEYPDVPKKIDYPGYGGGFAVNVESWNLHDIKVSKKGPGSADNKLKYRESDGAYIATYVIEVSTEKGTLDKVNVTDKVSQENNTDIFSFEYIKDSVTVLDSAGRSVSLSASQVSVSGKTLKITGLPKLDAGKKYTITYDAVILQNKKDVTEGSTSTINKGSKITNTVTAESGSDKKSAEHEFTVYPEITKAYDGGSDRNYTWTIHVNRNNSHSLAGSTFTDTMSGGMYATSNVTIKHLSSGKTKTLTLSLKDKPTTFSYTFTTADWTEEQLKGAFDISFKANAADASGDYSNNAHFITGKNVVYDHTRTIGVKAQTINKGAASGTYAIPNLDTYTLNNIGWYVESVILPDTMKAGETHTYEDELEQVMYRRKKDGSSRDCFEEYPGVKPGLKHYTYCKEIYNAFNGKIKVSTNSGFYKFDSSSPTTCTWSKLDGNDYAQNDGITFTLTGYDSEGNAYDIVANKNDATIQLTRFRISFKANKDLRIYKCNMGSAKYISYIYYGPQNDEIFTNNPEFVYFWNIISSTTKNWKDEVWRGWKTGINLTKDSTLVDGKNGEKYIDYRIVLHYDLTYNAGGPVYFTDQRSFDETKYGGGLGTYVEGSAKAVLYKDVELKTVAATAATMASKGYFSVDSSKDSEGKLVFKFDMLKAPTGYRVVVTYRIRIDDDEWWKNHKYKVYHNKVYDEHNHVAEDDTEWSRVTDVLDKKGVQEFKEDSQHISQPTGTINYSILINEGKADLDPKSDDIMLTDVMGFEAAYLDQQSIEIINLGTNLSSGEDTSSWDYNDATKTLTVLLKDETAYELKYTYNVNIKNIKEGTVLKNSAELAGFITNNIVEPEDLKGGGTVITRELTFTKQEEKNAEIKIKGAKFDLQKYNSGTSAWETVGNYETAEGGIIHFDIIGMNLESNVAYRLIETAPAPGYSDKDKDGNPVAFYFVIASEVRDKDAEEAAAKAFPDNVADENKLFFDYYGGTAAIKNRKVDTVEASVKKVWNDQNNNDKKRPTSLKVTLNKKVGEKTAAVKTVTLTAKGKWTTTVKNLPKYENDVEIEYFWTEDEAGLPKGYTLTNTAKNGTITTLTNSYTPETTEASVKKVWDDQNNNDGKRPATLTVTLSKRVGETTEKVQDVILPILPNDGKSEEPVWEATIDNLPKYDNGVEIEYIWTEDEESLPEGYELTGNTKEGTITTLTNSRGGDTTSATVRKVWNDKNNQDGKRPTSLKVILSKTVGTKTEPVQEVTLPVNGKWQAVINNLPKYEDGVEIKYSWTEDTAGLPEGYKLTKTAKSGTITTLTNSYTPETTEATIKKVWDDKNNNDGKRPATLTVTLSKKVGDTTEPVQEVTLPVGDKWEATIDKLPKYDKGVEIEYIWTEDETGLPKDYKLTGNSTEGTVTTLTNTDKPDLTQATVKKVWNDKNNQDGKRPDKLTVVLKKTVGNTTTDVKTVTLTAPKWSATVAGLPVYENKAKITYSWVEGTMPEGYKLSKTAKNGTITTLTNTYEPEKTTAHVVKVWNDDDDMDKRRPSEIIVKLLKDGADVPGSEVTLDGIVDEIETTAWEYTWTGLEKFKDGGAEVKYTVEEISISDEYAESGYRKNVVVDDDTTNGFKITITNTHDERPVSISKTDITGEKEVAGATLQVLTKDGKSITEWKSTDDGKPHVVYGLKPGVEYILREIVEPKGYTIAADTTFKIIVNKNGEFQKVESSGTVTDNNVVLVKDAPTKVNVRKVDAANGKELPGATLQIIDSKGKVFKEWISTEEDYVVTGLTAGEEYTLAETVTPLGFTVTSKTTFTVDNTNKVTSTGNTTTTKDGTPVLLVEDTMTTVTISKTDITGEKELKGATLQILDEEGNVMSVNDHDGKEVKCEWTSDGKPHVVEGLPTGKTYTLRETVGPEGFKIVSDATFSIDENNKITYSGKMNDSGVLLVQDEPTKVKVSKVDITGEKELQGATLQILDAEGNVVEIKNNDGEVVEKCEWVSTKEPKYIEGLKTETVYTLRETIAPDGYTIATEFKFTIAADGKVTSEGKTIKAEDTEDGVEILLVEDAPTKVYISKTDITNDKELPGAKLQVLDEDENVVVIKDNDGNPVETLEWVSGEEPKYIEGLPTGKTYILREMISPDGYSIASDTKFTIDEKGVVTSTGTTSKAEDGTTVLVVEDDLTTVQISKVDTESGKELEGAKLQIIDENGKVVEEWISTKEVHVVRGLVAGKKYILREQVAPLGYTLTSDTTFSIDMHNVVTSTGPVNKDGVILINDTMTEVDILKVDSKTGKGLKGAKLQVLDDNGNVCEEWTSTKDAHKIKGLYTGVKYTLHEVEAPKGYDKAKDITFTIDTAGKVSSDALENGVVVMKDTPTPSKSKNKTGDEANGALWALLLLMAGGALGGTVWFKRKKRA